MNRFLLLICPLLCLTGAPLAQSAEAEVLIAAHRGGYESERQDQCPENSLVNIDNAIAKGFQVFETDLRVTKDGVFVVVHDAEISLETTGTGSVEQQNWAVLKPLKKRYRNRGKNRSEPGPASDHGIATFEEFLKRADQRIRLKVDLKDDAHLQFAKIMKLVEKHGMLDWTTFRVRFSQRTFFADYIKTEAPYSKNTLMFKVQKNEQVDQVLSEFSPTMVEVLMKEKSPKPSELSTVKYATEKGLLVEQHSGKTEEDWGKQIEAGVRMFHTAAPLKLQNFLESRK